MMRAPHTRIHGCAVKHLMKYGEPFVVKQTLQVDNRIGIR
jgi:hypothetical protein